MTNLEQEAWIKEEREAWKNEYQQQPDGFIVPTEAVEMNTNTIADYWIARIKSHEQSLRQSIGEKIEKEIEKQKEHYGLRGDANSRIVCWQCFEEPYCSHEIKIDALSVASKIARGISIKE